MPGVVHVMGMDELKAKIDVERVPRHVAIIMDGNGRWARLRGHHRIFGHRNGVKAVRDTLTGAAEIGIRHLTLYAFSSENWNRPKDEVSALLDLFVQTTLKEVKALNKNEVRLRAIGDLDKLPPNCKKVLNQAIAETRNNQRITLTLALSYSSRCEIVHATRQIAVKVKAGEMDVQDIDENVFSQYLYTRELPDPDLIIRTSGEQRLSNFLMWQAAYTEFCFPEVLWPDFRKKHLFQAIIDFQHRERRFGKTSEQLTDNVV